MDEIARYNQARWRALAGADALFTRPALGLDPGAARTRLDPEGRLGDVAGKRVLCLAGGGGQQSAAFALLGAQVTVLDLSEEQLARDRQAAAHYGLVIATAAGDMRDLSRFAPAGFDVVWQPYSLNFVPDARAVFREVARVLQPGGLYHFNCANPFFHGLSADDWDGTGYALRTPYQPGAETGVADAAWVYDRATAAGAPIPGAREYRHTLSTLVAGLVAQGFVLLHLSDYTDLAPDPQAPPGTWAHFVAVAPPWLTFWARLRPEVFALR